MTFVLILLLYFFFQCDLMNSCSSIVIYMPIIPKSICTAQFSHKHSQPVSLHACRTQLLGRVPVWYLKNANVIVTLAFCCLKPLPGSDLAPLFHLLLTHSVMPTGSFLAGCICIFILFFLPVFPELQALFCHKFYSCSFSCFKPQKYLPLIWMETHLYDHSKRITLLTTQCRLGSKIQNIHLRMSYFISQLKCHILLEAFFDHTNIDHKPFLSVLRVP